MLSEAYAFVEAETTPPVTLLGLLPDGGSCPLSGSDGTTSRLVPHAEPPTMPWAREVTVLHIVTRRLIGCRVLSRAAERQVARRRWERIMRERDDTGASRRERRLPRRPARNAVKPADLVGCGFTADVSGMELVGDIPSWPASRAGCIWCPEMEGHPITDHHRALSEVDGLTMAAGRDRLQAGCIAHPPMGGARQTPAWVGKLLVVNASRIGELTVEFRIQGGSAGLVRPPGQSRCRWPRFALVAEGTAIDASAPLAQTRQQQGPT